jgi:hypothetical protein
MIMERTEVLDLMAQLRLFGMKNAYDEILATSFKRQHEPQRFAGEPLKAEISEQQARSIKYPLTIAKLPLAKDVDGFEFNGTPINESLARDLAGGDFIAQQARRCSGWRDRHRQDASGEGHREKLYPRRVTRPVLQHRRSGQPARGRRTVGPPGTTRRLSHAPRLRHPR